MKSRKRAHKYKMDLIPPALIVARYFAEEQGKLDELSAELEAASAAIAEHSEEHGVDDALLSDATNDKGAYTKQLLTAVIKAAKAVADEETLACANEALQLFHADAAARKAVKEAQAKLDLETLKKYGDLTEHEVKALVLDDKWRAAVMRGISGETEALTLHLVVRIQLLGERYGETLSDLETELENFQVKVAGHLAEMGVS